MKKITLLIMLVFITSLSFAQKTLLETLKSKISHTLDTEIKKYSDFGTYDNMYGNVYKLVIIDVKKDDNGKLTIDGEFSYPHSANNDVRTLKYQATAKQILDDFAIIKVIYEKNNKWYRIFPANEFDSN